MVEKETFIDAMSLASNTVNIVTTNGQAGRAGVTVSAMCSVSADRPTVLVCVHHLSPAAPAIRENGVFCVNVLKTSQSHISDTFAGRIEAPGGDKFGCADWHPMSTGSPGLEGCLAAFDCTVVRHFRWDTHEVFLGEVADAERDEGTPLIHTMRAYHEPKPLGYRAI